MKAQTPPTGAGSASSMPGQGGMVVAATHLDLPLPGADTLRLG